YARRYDSAGEAQGPEFLVNGSWTTGDQRSPAVALDAAGDFAIAWQSYGQDGSGYGIYAQRYSAAGTGQGPEVLVNSWTPGYQIAPAVALDAGGDLVVVWQSYLEDGSGYGIYAQRYDSAGAVQGSEFRVNTYTTSFQQAPAVAMDAAGDIAVTWESYSQD